MSDGNATEGGIDSSATVIGWVVPRPTGRWHQAIVVTDRHVWITPELTFADNSTMEVAASKGLEAFHGFVRHSGWVTRPDRMNVNDVRSINWNRPTGLLRMAGDDEIITAMIPNRDTGDEIEPLLKKAVVAHRTTKTETD